MLLANRKDPGMKLDLKTDGIKIFLRKLGQLFFAHSRMIYFVLFVGVLSAAIFSLNVTLNVRDDEAYRNKKASGSGSTQFDQQTIEKTKQLQARQQAADEPLPTDRRINPFGE